jgi:hypothetical protein
MVKIFVLIALSAALFCAYSIAAQSNRPSPGNGILGNHNKGQTDSKKNNSQNDQRGTEQSPLIVKMASSPNTKNEAAQAQKEKQEQAATNRRIEITTYVITGATFIQAIALIWTVLVMIRTTRRQLRAYVHVSSIAITNVANLIPPPGEQNCPETPASLSKDCGPIAFVEIKNTGQTPAYSVIHGTGIGVHEFPLKESLSMPSPSGHITKGVLPTGGTSHKIIIHKIPFTSQEIDQLRSETAKIYVYGIIKYKDTFGKSRTTYYRYMHPGEDKILGVSTVLTVCDEGNEAN